MSNTNASDTAPAPHVVIPLPGASAAAHSTGNGTASKNVIISSADVARLLSIQRELLPLTSGRPEAARLLEEMGRIVGPLAANPKDATKPIAYDPFFQVLGNPDILVHGLLFVSRPGLAAIMRVSKRWKSVLDGLEDKLWAGIAHRDGPLLFSSITGKTGRQWRDFLKRRFIMNMPPRVIRQPESSLLNLDKYVFELDFEVLVAENCCAFTPEDGGLDNEIFRDRVDYAYAQFHFILTACQPNKGSVLLRNDIADGDNTRRLKTVASTAVINSSDILGEDGGILIQRWSVRVTNKTTMKSASLLNDTDGKHFRHARDDRICSDRYTFQEDEFNNFVGNALIYTPDGHILRYPSGAVASKKAENAHIRGLTQIWMESSFESFLVSNEDVIFQMTVRLDGQGAEHSHQNLAFLFANLDWGYY